MFIVSYKNIPKNKLYYCYSPPLCEWLKKIKYIFPVSYGVYKKNNKFYGKRYELFIINDFLNESLKEWTKNKEMGIYAMKKSVENE